MSLNIERTERFKPFGEKVLERHEYARRWKAKNGGRVVGYFCTYVPEEILFAANILPVRILGDHQPQTLTDDWCSRNKWCPFSRNCLAEGLLGRYDYLDGVVVGTSCFHTQQVFASWVRHLPVSYWHYLYVPARLQGASAEACLRGEFDEFKRSLETWVGQPITTEALDRSISIHNENRRRMREIYELRKGQPPLLSGSDAMGMVLASQVMDKSEHNEMLEHVMAELPADEPSKSPGVRVMVIGSENDDRELLRAIESWGADVVIEDHCIGSRYFWDDVLPGEDRLEAIARRHAQKPPCPTKDFPERRRLSHILRLAKEFTVQAAILTLQKFCEPHEYDLPIIETVLREHQIPSVVIELDAPLAWGQIRMRVESLLDMIRVEA